MSDSKRYINSMRSYSTIAVFWALLGTIFILVQLWGHLYPIMVLPLQQAADATTVGHEQPKPLEQLAQDSYQHRRVAEIGDASLQRDDELQPVKPFSSKNRILCMLLSYKFFRMDSILAILHEHKSMCNAGWDVTVVIFTVVPPSVRMRRYLDTKVYCHRIQAPVKILFEIRSDDSPRTLGAETRYYLRDVWQQYDLYIYQEDDMIVEYNHVMAFLTETEKLVRLFVKTLESRSAAEDSYTYARNEVYSKYLIGFQRYLRHLRPFELRKTRLAEERPFRQEFLEEIPHFMPRCVPALPTESGDSAASAPYFEVLGNKRVPPASLYQAMWMLTREQMEVLQRKCAFLDQTALNAGGLELEYPASLSLFQTDLIPERDSTGKLMHCGLRKLIPAYQLQSFTVLHYYHQTNPELKRSSHALFETVDHLDAGLMQSNPYSRMGYFDSPAVSSCWKPLLDRHWQQYVQHANLSMMEEAMPFRAFDDTLYILESNGYKRRVKDESELAALGFGDKSILNGKHHMFDAIPLLEQ